MRAAQTPPHIATLVMLTGTSVLTLNMFLPSLGHMAEDFGVDYALMSFAIGGYLMMTAVTQVVVGPISDRYGRRPVVLVGMVVMVGMMPRRRLMMAMLWRGRSGCAVQWE